LFRLPDLLMIPFLWSLAMAKSFSFDTTAF
jgi:hypothetical protein